MTKPPSIGGKWRWLKKPGRGPWKGPRHERRKWAKTPTPFGPFKPDILGGILGAPVKKGRGSPFPRGTGFSPFLKPPLPRGTCFFEPSPARAPSFPGILKQARGPFCRFDLPRFFPFSALGGSPPWGGGAPPNFWAPNPWPRRFFNPRRPGPFGKGAGGRAKKSKRKCKKKR